jgi:hypothetical protein
MLVERTTGGKGPELLEYRGADVGACVDGREYPM